MKRALLIFSIVFEGAFGLIAQSGDADKFYFRGNMNKLDDSNIDLSFIRNHFMGDEIAKKLYLLKEEYTWIEEASPTNPTPRTMVDKTAIYNSVKKLERYYKKAIKKGDISEASAVEEFSKILDVAIVIRNAKTIEFEEFLKDIKKDDEQIVATFTKRVELTF